MKVVEARQLVALKITPMNGAYHFSWPTGQHSAQLSTSELGGLLRRLRAKDAGTEPASQRNVTYQAMVQGFIDGSVPTCWVWSTDLLDVPGHVQKVLSGRQLLDSISESSASETSSVMTELDQAAVLVPPQNEDSGLNLNSQPYIEDAPWEEYPARTEDQMIDGIFIEAEKEDFKITFIKFWKDPNKGVYALQHLDGFPEGLDLENCEITHVADDHVCIKAGGDWQELVPFCVYLKRGKLVIKDVYMDQGKPQVDGEISTWLKDAQKSVGLMENATFTSDDLAPIALRNHTSILNVKNHLAQALGIAAEDFGKSPNNFSDKERNYTLEVLEGLLESKEKTVKTPSLQEFLESPLSAKKFIEDVTSTGMPGVRSLPEHPVNIAAPGPENPNKKPEEVIAAAEAKKTIEDEAGPKTVPETGPGTDYQPVEIPAPESNIEVVPVEELNRSSDKTGAVQ